jgi:hypothetical protein
MCDQCCTSGRIQYPPEGTTGSAKYVGDCWKCGWPCYENLSHSCPTAPRYTGTYKYGTSWILNGNTHSITND